MPTKVRVRYCIHMISNEQVVRRLCVPENLKRRGDMFAWYIMLPLRINVACVHPCQEGQPLAVVIGLPENFMVFL